jgi:hypothetical protein
LFTDERRHRIPALPNASTTRGRRSLTPDRTAYERSTNAQLDIAGVSDTSPERSSPKVPLVPRA